ncbi:MAG: SDR family oxidoreductase, partial [Desulfuromonadales bacterium]
DQLGDDFVADQYRFDYSGFTVILAPHWVDRPCQPISVRNVLQYLVSALELAPSASCSFDIGGPKVVSYREVIQHMATALDLPRRPVLPIPPARMAALWIHLVTTVSYRSALPHADGLRIGAVYRDESARRLMAQRPLGVRESIDAALGTVAADAVETSWTDADLISGDPDWDGGTAFVHREKTEVIASAEELFRSVCRIGGRHGCYAADSLWRLRGLMDRVIGGPGLDRGRRSPDQIRHGDALDFWRVLAVEKDRRLKLVAEMKLPGEAVLELVLTECSDGTTEVRQCARFKPRGLLGLLYWYAVLPLHNLVFVGMLKGIAYASEADIQRGPESLPKRKPSGS